MDLTQTKHLFSVSEINQYLGTLLDMDPILNRCWIEGEITNCRYYQKGHQYYFSLTDGHSTINAVVFSSNLDALPFKPENGMHVVILGTIRLFQKRGTYSLQVTTMSLKGDGSLQALFEKRKAALEKAGYFDPDSKLPIPKYPTKVALITANPSAALEDFLTITSQFAPHLQRILAPAIMQGVQSSKSIIDALNSIESRITPDVIVILRGGGSAEDLASFNDPDLVKRIAACQIPIITAIGHETDTSLADLAADLRAETPSSAARLISQPFIECIQTLSHLLSHCHYLMNQQFEDQCQLLRYFLDQSKRSILHKSELLDRTTSDLSTLITHLNPLNKFKQGFSICQDSETLDSVQSISDLQHGQEIKTTFIDGHVDSTIKKITKKSLSL